MPTLCASWFQHRLRGILVQKIVQRTNPMQSLDLATKNILKPSRHLGRQNPTVLDLGKWRNYDAFWWCVLEGFKEGLFASTNHQLKPSPRRCNGKPVTTAFPGETLCVRSFGQSAAGVGMIGKYRTCLLTAMRLQSKSHLQMICRRLLLLPQRFVLTWKCR